MTQEVGDVVNEFRQEHRAMLTLLAHAAMASVTSRAGELFCEALFSTTSTLCDIYPEVAILKGVHRIRRAIRDLRVCDESTCVTLQCTVSGTLRKMYDVLPEQLLLVIAKVIDTLREQHPSCRALESYVLDLIEEIQLVILRETKLLQRRGETITLRLRDAPPFVL